jgi:outer membrane lipoprotein-sorting protein
MVAPNTLIYQFAPPTPPPPTPPPTYVTAEALADTYGPKYLILVLDDYNQNHLNKGLVNIATTDTKLSLPSYFTPGTNIALPPSYFAPGAIPVICDASGNPTYVQSSPRKLTQAQIYTINTIQKDRNNTTIDRYTGPTTTDVLALIPVKTYSLLPGQPYIEFGSALQTNERIYFGPVNIERMKIQLMDDKGNILNMHGNDWSFTITSTHLYEY